MSITAEIKGKSADRYRAYAAAKMLRRSSIDDQAKRADAKLAPLTKGAKIRYDVEEVVSEGAVSGESLAFNAPDGVTITKVVFYKNTSRESDNEHHTIEDEEVVGSVDVNAAGAISITIIEPVEDETEIVDEDKLTETPTVH